ncbi:hypothetical protein NQ317_012154 [Molorchus minor]|uniref:Uncharacterized protein n=1 Tax=Molorchus minor TaxID=1323400 RepID=A0ABQ9J336_9CUCU|nr:hypothetical protein NQ317_012154 [Molorchus minor]
MLEVWTIYTKIKYNCIELCTCIPIILNPIDDRDAIKMAENVDEYPRYHASEPFDSNLNSSDSDQDNYVASPKNELPKRNKRKNFKPRCSNVSYSDSDFPYNNEALNLSEYSENNNVNNNVRRRKTLSTRKVVVDSRFSPMDLSKANETDSNSDSEFNEQFAASDNDDNENSNSENDSKIPQSFSIHNLSKPHVSDYPQTPQNLSQDQVSEMRQYAMNTMRELLGIYGLTSEVAESISRQLPTAAFSPAMANVPDKKYAKNILIFSIDNSITVYN